MIFICILIAIIYCSKTQWLSGGRTRISMETRSRSRIILLYPLIDTSYYC